MTDVYGSARLAAKLSRRTVLRAGLGAAAALADRPRRVAADSERPSGPGPTGPAASAGPALSLFTWEGYAPTELVGKFQRETGIKVTVATYASNRELLGKLKASRGGYDLVQPTVTLVPAGVHEEYYRPIDPGRLRNAGNLIPGMVRAAEALGGVIRGEVFALPFCWGAEGLSYDTRRLGTRPTSYGILHDDAHAGRLTYRATVHAFVATGLWLGLGHRMRDIYVSEDDARPVLDVALDRLIEDKKLVKAYWSTVEEVEKLLGNGDVDVAQTWDATGWKLARAGKPIRFTVPGEGGLAWMDTFAVPKDARHVQEAYAWMDFMYDPRNAAEFSSDTRYGTAVRGTAAFLEPAFKREYEGSFSPEVLDNLWWYGIEHSWFPSLMREYVERLRAA